jgi:hypothetical protein
MLKMKIRVVSSFVIPGLEDENEIYFDHPTITLREVLEEVSSRSSNRVKFIHPSTGAVDPMAFDIEINGLPNQGSRETLETVLKEGDTITINLLPLGGG